MLQVKNLSYGYNPSFCVLQNIEFSSQKPIVNIIAAEGQGVTTCLKCMAGLLPTEDMELYIHNTAMQNLSAKDKNFSLLLRRLEFFEHRSVLYNLQYQLKIHKILQPIEEFLQKIPVKIDSILTKKIQKLSLVEKCKVAIVRALLKRPKILFIDDADFWLAQVQDESLFESAFSYVLQEGGCVVLGSHIPLPNFLKTVQYVYLENGKASVLKDAKISFNKIKTVHEFQAFYSSTYTQYELLYRECVWYSMEHNIIIEIPEVLKNVLNEDVFLFVKNENILNSLTFKNLKEELKTKKAVLFSKLTGERIFL